MLNLTSIRRSLKLRKGRNERKARHTWAAVLRALPVFGLVIGSGAIYPPLAAGSMWCVCWVWEEGDPIPDCTVYDDPPPCTGPCCPPPCGDACGGEGGGAGTGAGAGAGAGGGFGPGSGSANVGPGVFVNAATGNVWTEVPVIEARVADRSALSFRLRYDSRFAGGDSEFRSLFRQTVLGPGWTHSYNGFAFKGTHWGHTEFMVIDAQGRRRNYDPLSGGVGTAKMPGVFSWITRPDAYTYRVHYENGGYEEYDLIEASEVTPQYLNDIEDGLTGNGSHPEEGGDWYQLTKVVDRRGRTTELVYDHETTGLLTEIRGPYDNNTITLAYKPGTELLEEIHHPDGAVTVLSYDDEDRLIGIQDPEQNSRTYTYKSTTDHRIESETLRNGVKYRIYYGNDSVEIKDTHPGGSPNSRYVMVWTNDDAWDDDSYYCDQTFQARTRGGTVTVRKGLSSPSWTYEVDGLGRTLSFTPPTDPNDPTSRIVVNTYDDETGDFAAGTHTLTGTGSHRLRSRQMGDFAPTYYAYDGETGKITAIVDPEDNLTGYEHNDSNWPGLVTKRIEPDGDEWSYAYSANRGDLLSENLTTNGGSDPSRTITYSYTYFTGGRPGRLEKQVRTNLYGNITTWNFSANGTMDSVVKDEGGLNVTTGYTHDVMGRVRTRAQVRGQNSDVEVEYFYDDAGHLTRTVVNSNGLALETAYGYDGEGYLTHWTDPRGVVTNYKYDRRNRLVEEIVDSNGLNLITQYDYDGTNNLTKITDPKQQDTNIYYYNFDLARLIIDAEGYDTNLKWDALGNLTRIEHERAPGSETFHETSLTYDGLSRLTDMIQDPDGLALQTSYEYDDGGTGCGCSGTPGAALVSEITDPAGKRTYYQYDNIDRLERIIREVGGATGPDGEPDDDDVATTIEYDDANNTVEIINPENESVLYALDAAERLSTRRVDPMGADLLTTYVYDGNSPVRTVTVPNGNVVTHAYDAAGRRTGSSDTVGDIAAFTYSANGAVLTVTDGEGNVTSNGYDKAGRLTSVKDPNGETETYQYDANGNLTRLIDRELRETEYEYDALDRVTKVTEDDGDGGLKRITEYSYDGLDNMLTLTAYVGTNGTGTVETTTYKFDSAGRLFKVIYPDNEEASSNGIARFTYYPAGTIHTRTDQKGVVTTYVYDDLHRLTDRSYNDGGITPTDAFGYDKASRLAGATNNAADLTFTYDDAGRLTDADQTMNSVTYATDLHYSIDTQLHTLTRTLTYPGAVTDLVETYDGRGRLDSIVYGSRNLVGSSTYDDADRMTARSLGNGINSTWQHDPNGWLQMVQHVKDALALERVSYGHDKVGNVKYRAVETPGREHLSEIYQYDTLHRLTRFERGVLNANQTAVVEAAPVPFVQTRAWTNLDMLGNWRSTDTTIGGDSPETDARTVNAANEYLTQQIGSAQQIDLTSDDNGSLTDDGSQLYEYDAENRLIRVTRKSDGTVLQEYAYDALGRRVVTTDLPNDPDEKITTHVHADSAACIAEYDSTQSEGQTEERWFVHGPGFPDPLVMVDLTSLGDVGSGAEEFLYYLKDLLGSVTALANSNGTVVERYVYDPYGKTTIETPTFYHDADLDGDVDDTDFAHFEACWLSSDPLCVFVHDRTGNNLVDGIDLGLIAGCYTTNGVAPGPECARWSSAYFDPNGDGQVNLYDFAGFQECFGATDDLCWFLYDVNADAEVDLDDFAKFHDHIGDSGVPHPVIADRSRYGNPFMWTGQRYDAAVGLYHFKYRSYSPVLGRWLQRDPLGYVDSESLYEYVISNPAGWIDPFGLKLKVGGSKTEKKRIEDLLKKLCPRAKVTPKSVELEPDKEDSEKDPEDSQPSEACPDFLSPCELLRRLIESDTLYVIVYKNSNVFDWNGKIKHIYLKDLKNRFPKIKGVDGKWRVPKFWEVLWHELTHADRYDSGTHRGKDPREEEETIRRMNGYRKGYNKDKDEDEQIPPRDPKSHDEKPPEEL